MNVKRIHKFGNEIWAIEEDYNYLIKRDLNSEKTYLVKELDLNGVYKKQLYSSFCIDGDELIIAPGIANNFFRYSITKDELSEVKMVDEDEIAESAKSIIKFGEAYMYEGSNLFLGVSFPGFAYINKDDRRIELYRLDDEIIEGMEGRTLGRTGALIDNCLYVPAWRKDIMIKFDFSSRCISYLNLNTSSQYVTAIKVKNEIWLLKYEDYSIDIINSNGHITGTITLNSNAKLGNCKFHYLSGFCRKDSVWVMPLEEKNIIEIDSNDKTVKSSIVMNDNEGLTFTYATMLDDSVIYLYSGFDNRNYILSNNNRIEEVEFVPQFMPTSNSTGDSIFYEDVFSLPSLIRSMIGE